MLAFSKLGLLVSKSSWLILSCPIDVRFYLRDRDLSCQTRNKRSMRRITRTVEDYCISEIERCLISDTSNVCNQWNILLGFILNVDYAEIYTYNGWYKISRLEILFKSNLHVGKILFASVFIVSFFLRDRDFVSEHSSKNEGLDASINIFFFFFVATSWFLHPVMPLQCKQIDKQFGI